MIRKVSKYYMRNHNMLAESSGSLCEGIHKKRKPRSRTHLSQTEEAEDGYLEL